MTHRAIAQPLRTNKNLKCEKAIKVKRNEENVCFLRVNARRQITYNSLSSLLRV